MEISPLCTAGDEDADKGVLRILVVDDNVDSAKTMAFLLKSLGHEVRMAHDGNIALRMADSFHPDVIVLDIGLPGISGLEVARRIRDEGGTFGIVLIALTGYGQAEVDSRFHDAGFDYHLVKPADFSELKRILTAIYGK